MFLYRLLPGLCVIFSWPGQAQDRIQDIPEYYPSLQLLEFLADFGTIDDETYELIEYHALQDIQTSKQETPDDE